MSKKVISVSEKKNIQMVVYHNEGPDGKKASITRHEVLQPGKKVYRRKTASEIKSEARGGE